MSTTAIAPIGKERQTVYKRLTPKGKELCDEIGRVLQLANTGTLVAYHSAGRLLLDASQDEGAYGADIMTNLSAYFNISAGDQTLFNLRAFAHVYTKDEVKSLAARVMPTGQQLKLDHFIQFVKVPDETARKKLESKTIANSWSAREVQLEIRGGGAGETRTRHGGRKPQTPTSPIAGLQKAFELTQRFNRFGNVFEDAVCDRLDSISPDRIDKSLLKKLTNAHEQLVEMTDKSKTLAGRVQKNIDRVQSVLDGAKPKGASENGTPVKKMTAKMNPKNRRPAVKA